MPFVSFYERAYQKAYEEGLRQSLCEGVDFCLDLKFGRARRKLMPMVRTIRDVKVLRALMRTITKAKTLDDVRTQLKPKPRTRRKNVKEMPRM
jgi:hypothetical protein